MHRSNLLLIYLVYANTADGALYSVHTVAFYGVFYGVWVVAMSLLISSFVWSQVTV